MNDFKITKRLNEERQPEGPHPVKMTLSANADSSFSEIFRTAYEIEILQGSRKVLPSGSVRYCFKLDNEKVVQLEQALTLAYFEPTQN